MRYKKLQTTAGPSYPHEFQLTVDQKPAKNPTVSVLNICRHFFLSLFPKQYRIMCIYKAAPLY